MPSAFVDGYQAALLDILGRMEEEANAENAAGTALGWIIHNGSEELRLRATSLVQRLFTTEEN